MLPGLDGLEVCRRIQRDRHVPVLMLTARDSEADVELGLAVGGDDYLTKPFSPRELVARVRALLRRVERAPAPSGDAIRLGKLLIDPAAREVTLEGEVVHLTPTEFDLLHRLAKSPHVVFARSRLLHEVWGYRDRRPASARSTRTCARCRRKLGARRHPHRARRRLRAEQERARREAARLPRLDQAQARGRDRRRGARHRRRHAPGRPGGPLAGADRARRRRARARHWCRCSRTG